MPPRLESFQDRSFRFACEMVKLYVTLSSRSGVPGELARQMLRAGTSIGAQLEEAKAAHTRRDSAAKFSIALKEARETCYWLRLFKATELVSASLLNPLLSESGELIAILTVARRKLNAPSDG